MPRDFIEDVTRDAGVKVDWAGFDQRDGGAADAGEGFLEGRRSKDVANPAYTKLAETFKTEPDFYFGTETRDCRIEAIITKTAR